MKSILSTLVLLLLVAFSSTSTANRLLDPNNNRCGNDQIPVSDCPAYQNAAYNNGNGCITLEEFNYAKQKLIAPLCSQINNTVFVGFCRCGCFQEGTKVLTYDESTGGESWANIESIPKNEDAYQLFTLAEDATLSNMLTEADGIEATTVGPESKPLVIIETNSGKVVGLTETHGVLLSNGTMTVAGDLTEADELVNMDGSAEPIVKIYRKGTSANVYNVLTKATLSDKNGHLIVAEGLVLGDLYWQNILEAELKQFELRQ